jgi:hypothetical protein
MVMVGKVVKARKSRPKFVFDFQNYDKRQTSSIHPSWWRKTKAAAAAAPSLNRA